MKKIRLMVERREQNGSNACGRLRRKGIVPAVLYGPSETKNLQVLKPVFREMMLKKGQGAALIELVCGSDVTLSMLQATQRNPRTDDYLHIDFKKIDPTKEMVTKVPLRFVGEPVGVKDEGGVLDIARHTISIVCLPENLPEFIEVDMATLGLGHSIHVKDLPKYAGISYKTAAEDVIVSCIKIEGEGEESSVAAEIAAEGSSSIATPVDVAKDENKRGKQSLKK